MVHMLNINKYMWVTSPPVYHSLPKSLRQYDERTSCGFEWTMLDENVKSPAKVLHLEGVKLMETDFKPINHCHIIMRFCIGSIYLGSDLFYRSDFIPASLVYRLYQNKFLNAYIH